MPYEEIAGFIADLRKRPSPTTLALEFCILTAARSGEVLGARWSEIDLAKRIWTVPAHRMKAGREHRVPLSDRAMSNSEDSWELTTESSCFRVGSQEATIEHDDENGPSQNEDRGRYHLWFPFKL